MKFFNLAYVTVVLMAPIASAQISQIEQKETRTFLGTQNRGYGPMDYYKFSGATNKIVIPEGKSITVLDCYSDSNHNMNISIKIRFGSSEKKISVFNSSIIAGTINPFPSSPVGKSFIGPCEVEIILESGFGSDVGASVGYNISNEPYYAVGTVLWRYETGEYGSNQGLASSNLISAASVVVPSNATGDVDVMLEQSTDMITWTQCLPGTYNASTQKRFFRVRAVEK